MNTYRIDTTYSAGYSTTIDLPEGKTWDDVADWYVKWGTLNIILKGEGEKDLTFDLDSDIFEGIDWKRPEFTQVSLPDSFDIIDEQG